jgi:hypothetical protein
MITPEQIKLFTDRGFIVGYFNSQAIPKEWFLCVEEVYKEHLIAIDLELTFIDNDPVKFVEREFLAHRQQIDKDEETKTG